MAAKIAIAIVNFYRKWVSPLTMPSCRFYPSCSSYAIDAISHHGFVRGSLLTTGRILRCHPFHPGGVDPVPGDFSLKNCCRSQDI